MTTEILKLLQEFGLSEKQIKDFDRAAKSSSCIGNFMGYCADCINVDIYSKLDYFSNKCDSQFREYVVNHYSL